jgi:phosphocarrier protein HPr
MVFGLPRGHGILVYISRTFQTDRGTGRIEMEIQTFTIRNRLGLHARAAALVVKTANRFEAEVVIEKDGLEVNGKSIMGILMLAASKGTRITLKADGKDSVQAIRALGELIENKFGEE